MPRYGEASVVGKAWADDHPIASAVVPGAAFTAGAYKLKSGIAPNTKGAVSAAQGRVTEASGKVEAALRRQNQANRMMYHPHASTPLRGVGQRVKGLRLKRAAAGELKAAETAVRNAEAGLKHTQALVPKSLKPKVRMGRAALGSALVAGGGYGLYRRFGAPRPQGAPDAQMG